MAKKQAHVIISGIVQMVGFRFFTRRLGQSLGVTGWVRNRADGTVEVVVEGDEDDIKYMIKRLKEGPRSARVDNVDVDWGEYTGNYSSFSVRF